MKKGDKLIWDSHFGYEIGYFIEDSENILYNSFNVRLVTGIIQEETLLSRNEILPYTLENLNRMKEKYGYDKVFSEIF